MLRKGRTLEFEMKPYEIFPSALHRRFVPENRSVRAKMEVKSKIYNIIYRKGKNGVEIDVLK